MKLMIKSICYTPKFYIICVLILSVACNNDPCNDVHCIHGSCSEGICLCEAGYEGADCSTKSVVKFIGSWLATDQCGTDINQYTATIAASSASIQLVTITNFGGLGSNASVAAYIDGSTITINNQDAGNNYSVSGLGTINEGGNQIEITYTVIDPLGNNIECSAIWNFP